jgi:uroporphyrinogen-III synthase
MTPAQSSGGRRPLSGTRILVGRARHQASALSVGLQKLGAEVIEIPFIEIRPARSYRQFDAALKKITEYDWLILTSVNGVDALAARLKRLKLSSRKLQALKIAAIGPPTRESAEKLGLKVAVVPKKYVAESVVESLRGKVDGKRVLLARAKVARDVIPRELRKVGARVDVVEAYETVIPASSKKKLVALMSDPKRCPNVITFTSSSTARNFVKLLGRAWTPAPTLCGRGSLRQSLRGDQRHMDFEGIRFASIGPITSATLRELGLPVDVEAKEYTIPGLVQAIVRAQPV